MRIRTQNIIFLFVLAFTSCFSGSAQELNKNWSAEKIRGTRQLPYASYNGFPFLTDTWVRGTLVFADGEISDTLYLRYSSYKDELVYFNKTISVQITIDKASLKGFSFIEKDGSVRVFRKQYYDGFWKGDRYFEVLAEGKTNLLAYRKVSLASTFAYKDESGIMKNQEYALDYYFYFYSPGKGYLPVKINRTSLLSKFDKSSQRPIKKLLRKDRIHIVGEDTFVQAWKAIEKEGFQLVY